MTDKQTQITRLAIRIRDKYDTVKDEWGAPCYSSNNVVNMIFEGYEEGQKELPEIIKMVMSQNETLKILLAGSPKWVNAYEVTPTGNTNHYHWRYADSKRPVFDIKSLVLNLSRNDLRRVMQNLEWLNEGGNK